MGDNIVDGEELVIDDDLIGLLDQIELIPETKSKEEIAIENDSKNISYILDRLQEQIDLSKINHLVHEGQRKRWDDTFEKAMVVKDNVTLEDLNLVVKYIILNIDLSNEEIFHDLYSIVNLRTNNEEILRVLYDNEKVREAHGIYVLTHPNCPQDIMIDKLNSLGESKDTWSQKEMLLKRVQDIEVLKEYAKDPLLVNGIIENSLINNEILEILIDNVAKEYTGNGETFQYRYGKNLREIVEKFEDLPTNLLDKIMDSGYAYSSIGAIASHKNISYKAIQTIIDWQVEDGSNAYFSRANLLENESVKEEFTTQIIEQNNYYNSNKDNIVAMMKDSIEESFGK